MEISELKCYKLSHGFSSVGTDTSSWDNDFAVGTRTGVHVMSLMPNLTSKDDQIRIKRTHIKTPDTYLQPNVSIDMKSMNREKFCLLNLDSKLIPVTDKTHSSATHVKQIGFINFYLESSPKSLLGILTNHGCLQLFSRDRYRWKNIVDVSQQWKKYWLSLRNEKKTALDFESLTKRFKNLRLVSFVNAESFRIDEDEKYWLLICVNEIGVVSFWKMNLYAEQEEPSLINTEQLNLNIHTLYWHSINDREGWFVASSTSGIVKIYSCTKNESGELSLVLLHDIWEDADSIHALNLKIKRPKECRLMAFSKENTVFVRLFKETILNYSFEFKQKVVAIEIIDDSQMFVTLLSRETFILNVDKGTCECSPVSLKTITDIQHHKIYGMSFSKNGAFCAISCSISAHYDHLSVREPWYVLFCSTRKSITQSMMLKLNNASLYDAYDWLELFRLSLIKNDSNFDTVDLDALWNSLNQEIGVCRKNFQTMYILSRCYPLCQNTKHVIAIEIAFVVSNFLYFSDKLSDIRKQYYFYQWLSSNISKLPENLLEKRHIKDVSQRMTNFMEYCADERCELCGSDISNHSNLKLIVCEKQHKVLRCSFGFLPVTQSYSECSLCHSVQLISEGLTRCVICDNKI